MNINRLARPGRALLCMAWALAAATAAAAEPTESEKLYQRLIDTEFPGVTTVRDLGGERMREHVGRWCRDCRESVTALHCHPTSSPAVARNDIGDGA